MKAHKMLLKWKRKIPLKDGIIKEIEDCYKIKLPQDFKQIIPEINGSRPTSSIFDIKNRAGCFLESIIDYNTSALRVIDYDEKKEKEVENKNLIIFGADPFGNFCCFRYDNNGNYQDIVFWYHEEVMTKNITYIASTFTDFFNMLYCEEE